MCTALELSRASVQLKVEPAGDHIWAGFVGAACERVSRNRGTPTLVAPLLELRRGLYAWLGFIEVWEKEAEGTHYIFSHLSLTVHFGFVGDLIKPQIFRAEWAGIRNWTGAGHGFQSSGAGHPHWQFDLNESLRSSVLTSTEEFNPEPDTKVEDFADTAGPPNILELMNYVTVERMHFASAAAWWKARSAEAAPHHMNAPSNEEGLTRWLVGCISYLRQELSRCEIVSA